ncbi:hypothetical protein BC829DRAFT_203171 [Chytridium lagenaria]|nr:hypothetical protein BC829DRAFT_203171 [Chytridium lagenaria]
MKKLHVSIPTESHMYTPDVNLMLHRKMLSIFLESFTSIENLNIQVGGNCHGLHSDSILALATSALASSLVSLSVTVHGTPEMGPSLRALFSSTPKLQHLNILSSCETPDISPWIHNLATSLEKRDHAPFKSLILGQWHTNDYRNLKCSDEAFVKFFKASSSLEAIAFGAPTFDKVFKALAEHCPNLWFLQTDCWERSAGSGVTAVGVKAVLKLPKLEVLDVSHGVNLKPNDFGMFLERDGMVGVRKLRVLRLPALYKEKKLEWYVQHDQTDAKDIPLELKRVLTHYGYVLLLQKSIR